MKVLLISSWYDAYGEAKYGDRLGILYLAGYLEQNGIQVEVVDALWDNLSSQKMEEIIANLNPDLVGVSCYIGSRFEDFKVIKLVKKINPKIVTVMGGPQATATAEDTLTHVPELDFIVLGEGEITLLELGRTIEKRADNYESIKGIAYIKNKIFIQNPHREFIQNLDSLPLPARHLHPKYKSLDQTRMFYVDNPVGIYNEKFSTVQVMASRGCPYNCWFCSTTQFWRHSTRFRSVGNVMKELESLKQLYNVRAINFADDTFNINPKYLFSLCDAMIEKKLGFKWQCNFRANETATKELLIRMKEAGCTGIRMGVESGSSRILRQVKGITKEQVRKIVSWCKEIGLGRRLNFIINFPGETIKEAKQTVGFAKEFGEPYLVNPLVIYPGTYVEEVAKKNGCLPENFSWSDPKPHLKYVLPGRITDIPMFVDTIPFRQVTDLIFRIESERKVFFSIFKRIKEVFRSIHSVSDLMKIFSVSNFIYLLTYFKFRLLKIFRKKFSK